jgi:hypothetical protein
MSTVMAISLPLDLERLTALGFTSKKPSSKKSGIGEVNQIKYIHSMM